MKKLLVVILISFFVVGCGHKISSKTRFFNNQQNLIYEFNGSVNLQEIYDSNDIP